VAATMATSTAGVSEERGQITYTVTLSNVDNLPATGHSGLSFTLVDGTIIGIPAGQASGSYTVHVPAQDDSVIGGQAPITKRIQSVEGQGVFEAFETAGNTSVAVTDEPVDPENPETNPGDAVTVVLTATPSTGEDQGQITYTATLRNANGNVVTTANA